MKPDLQMYMAVFNTNVGWDPEPYMPTQPSTLSGTENEYTGQSAVTLCDWRVKAVHFTCR